MPYQDEWAKVHNIPVRPLIKGMIKNLPSNALPAGAYREIENYRVSDVGLTKRGGIIPFNTNEYVADTTYMYENVYKDLGTKIQDVIYFWKPDAFAETILVTNSQLFEMQKDNKLLNRAVSSTIAAADISGFTVTGNVVRVDTTITDETYWRVGDFAKSDDGENLGLVKRVGYTTGNFFMEIDFGTTVTPSGGISGNHTFVTNDVFGVDSTVLPGYTNKIILTDIARRGIYEYNGSTLTMMTIDNQETGDPVFKSAKVCTAFADRLWVANTVEDTGTNTYVQRIRWSQPATFNAFRDADFVDLPYADGEILKMVPMGSILVVYTQDAIYFGRRTNVAGLPYNFTRMETGGIGPVSQRAIQPWIDGHFFVGNDDVYWFNGSTGLQPIADPVLKDTLTVSKNLNLLNGVEIAHDPIHESIVFLFPDVPKASQRMSGLSTKLWLLNTQTKGWSYYSAPLTDSGIPRYYFSTVTASRYTAPDETWQDWVDKGAQADWIDSDSVGTEEWIAKNSWLELGSSKYKDKTLYVGLYYRRSTTILTPDQWTQGVYYEADGNRDRLDATGTRTFPIHVMLESADYDLQTPEVVKTVLRLSLKCWEQIAERLIFNIEVSNDRGRNWKNLPLLRWNPHYDEGRDSFRSTGTNFRFRISSSQDTSIYTLTEMVMRVSGRGLQADL